MADLLTDDLARLAPTVDTPAAVGVFSSTVRGRRRRRRGVGGGVLAVAVLAAGALVVTTVGDDRATEAVVAGPAEEATAPLPVGDPAFEVILTAPSSQAPGTLAAATTRNRLQRCGPNWTCPLSGPGRLSLLRRRWISHGESW